MFVVSLTYTVDLNQVDQVLQQHIAYLDEQYRLGHFLASGRKEPRTGGVILATAADRAELEAILAQDPFYQAELALYDITEVIVSRAAIDLQTLIGR